MHSSCLFCAQAHQGQEALEKKVAVLGNLHKENDSRSQALRKEKERVIGVCWPGYLMAVLGWTMVAVKLVCN